MTPETTRVAPPPVAAQPDAPGRGWTQTLLRWSNVGVIVLLFGINQAWHGGQKEVTVQLTDRLILSPFAAKRLSILLSNVLREHEARFGPVAVEAPRVDAPPAS